MRSGWPERAAPGRRRWRSPRRTGRSAGPPGAEATRENAAQPPEDLATVRGGLRRCRARVACGSRRTGASAVTCGHAARPRAARPRPGPPGRRSVARSRSTSRVSRPNVSSAPIDFGSCHGSTGRSSIPWASSQRWAPSAPRRASRRTGPGAASSPIVRAPGRSSRSAAGPPPTAGGSAGSRRNAASWPGATSTRPSGFSRSDAIFARNLFGATPADAVRPTSAGCAP